MDVPSGVDVHARHGDGSDRGHDRGAPPPADGRPRPRRRLPASLIAGLLAAAPAAADTLRLAVYDTDLQRDGPGLLLRDILRGEDEQVAALISVIADVDPDVLLLIGIDYDAGLAALSALADRLAAAGADYPHRFALRPNAGIPTGNDIDGDGRWPEPQDAQGYGRFSGEGGMAILSRLPVDGDGVRDFSGLLWRDLPGNRAADVLAPEAAEVLRLSTMGIWDVPLVAGDDRFHVLAITAGPPVFDGPEDRNGIRNEDETAFLLHYLDGWSPDGAPFAAEDFAIMGILNVDPDPARGEGRRGALSALLSHPAISDPEPRGAGGTATADWDDPVPGDLRVDYILPAAGLTVTGSGVHWPEDPAAAETAATASAHRLVWVDVDLGE
ncbi:endonuclease/exonuclease/phosphatase family protein [Rhodobacterales bacterium HKCCE2091]|nr:endonuclease/exonuclease/phosphatase family protein [Rhodobacterales bacterium HKCCE2091]